MSSPVAPDLTRFSGPRLLARSRVEGALALVVLFGFGAVMAAIASMLWFRFDDWGIATLTYAATEAVGYPPGPGDVVRHLTDQYLTWSPRLAGYGVLMSVLNLGVVPSRALFVVMMLVVVLTSSSIASGRLEPRALAFAALYILAMPVFIVADGLVWFTAAVFYGGGAALFMSGIALYARRNGHGAASVLLMALAVWFHEQVAVMVIVLSVLLWLTTRRGLVWHCIAALAAVPVLLAPANFARKAAQGGEIAFADNLNALAEWFLFIPAWPWAVFLGLAGGAVFLAEWQRVGRRERARLFVLAAGVGVALPLSSVLAFLGALGFFGWLLWREGHVRGTTLPALVFAAALAGLSLVLVSDSVPARSLLAFYFVLTPVLVWALAALPLRETLMRATVLGVLAIPAAHQTTEVARALALNAPHQAANHRALEAGGAGPVNLTIPPIPLFGGPQGDRVPRIAAWMRRYHGLDDDVVFEWHPVTSLR